MYDRRFLQTRLGQAALLSISAMVTFVALSSQIVVTAPAMPIAYHQQVELA